MWEREVTQMRERIRAMRHALHEVLSARVPGRDFGYLLTQRGMFSYTGLLCGAGRPPARGPRGLPDPLGSHVRGRA